MIVNFVLMLTVLLGFCGLALDVGMLELDKLQMQNAADAAALSGMIAFDRNTAIWNNSIDAASKTAAIGDATQNGFTQGVANTTVTITSSPAGGFWSNDYSAVQAVVTQVQNPLFMGILNSGPVTLSAVSVAYAAPCAYFMSNNPAFYSLYLASNTVHSSCPVYVNRALANDYFAKSNARAWRVAGVPAASAIAANTRPVNYFNAPVLADPLAWIPSPAFQACTVGDTNLPTIKTPTTLNPGTFCGGIKITGASVTLNPGLYIITGGVLWQGGAVVKGTGVTLFLTKKPGDANDGQFNVQNSTVNLSAPTTGLNGSIPGIVVFGDRRWVPTSTQDFILNGSSSSGDGIWYITNTGVYMWSTTGRNVFNGTNYCGIVTDSMYAFAFTISYSSNYSSLPGGSPFHTRGALVQ